MLSYCLCGTRSYYYESDFWLQTWHFYSLGNIQVQHTHTHFNIERNDLTIKILSIVLSHNIVHGHVHWPAGASVCNGSQGFHPSIFSANDNSLLAWSSIKNQSKNIGACKVKFKKINAYCFTTFKWDLEQLCFCK